MIFFYPYYIALKCIDEISNTDDEQVAMVLAFCVGKAKNMGKNILTMYGMKKIIDIIAQEKPINKEAINLPALVRCTLQLQLKNLISNYESGGSSTSLTKKENDNSISETFQMIEKIVHQSIKFCLESSKINEQDQISFDGGFTHDDILWIASKIYYAALVAMKIPIFEHTISLSKLGLEVRRNK